MHTARFLPAGLHLYDIISGESRLSAEDYTFTCTYFCGGVTIMYDAYVAHFLVTWASSINSSVYVKQEAKIRTW